MAEQPGGLIIKERKCPYCGLISDMNARQYANHVRWCKKNPKYEETLKSTVSKVTEKNKEYFNEVKGEFKDFEVECHNCGKKFIVNEREKLFPSKEVYYCSRSCANTRHRTEEFKQQQSLRMHEYYGTDVEGYTKICPMCGTEFYTKKKHQKYCSMRCSGLSKKNIDNYDEYLEYKKQCAFKFALNSFPDEFNFDIVREYGWYKAKNHGDNLYGVSRDHMFSVNEGYHNGIDPYIISHPANCELLTQSLNSSKHKRSSLTIDELKERIIKWNEKYGVYNNNIDYRCIDNIIKIRI